MADKMAFPNYIEQKYPGGKELALEKIRNFGFPVLEEETGYTWYTIQNWARGASGDENIGKMPRFGSLGGAGNEDISVKIVREFKNVVSEMAIKLKEERQINELLEKELKFLRQNKSAKLVPELMDTMKVLERAKVSQS